MSHNKGKIIAEDFFDGSDEPKIIYRSDIRSYIYTQVYLNQNIKNLSKKNINNVMHHFNILEKDRNKIKNMMNIILHRNNFKSPPLLSERNNNYELITTKNAGVEKKNLEFKYRSQKSNIKNQNFGGNFWSSHYPPKIIPRAAIRAFIYENAYIHSKIRDVKKHSVNLVLDQFNMLEKDRNKVKKMMITIMNRDNEILPPILYESSDDDNSETNEEMEKEISSDDFDDHKIKSNNVNDAFLELKSQV